jgi:glycosyltransferase involved in cell wall biosynthesis
MSTRADGILHLVDTLEFGGAERAAVDYVNHLPRNRYRPFLCTTRRSGPLASQVRGDVTMLHLNRRRTLDWAALRELLRFIGEQHIRLVHAHGSALFVARLAQLVRPRPALVWHLHYGKWAIEDRRDWRYLLAAIKLNAVVTASDELATWIRKRFFASRARVMHLPNMVAAAITHPTAPELPGKPGWRIVSVANLRPEKDHLTLLQAFAAVVSRFPEAHLLLVGGKTDAAVSHQVEREIAKLGLGRSVSLLGPRADVASVLAQCDLAVLSSVSEGLPVSLLEYGMAGLPTVATHVGQCPVVLDQGAAGMLVPPRCPVQIASALESLLLSESLRRRLGEAFRQRVQRLYGVQPVTEKLCGLYELVLGETGRSL